VVQELIDALEEIGDSSSEKIAQQWREQAMEELRGNGEELRRYTTEVQESEDNRSYEWRVEHPTARQYEMGGTIFHTYDDAKSVGWTRDQFYETLEDCQEIIPRQRYAMKSAIKIKGEVER